MMQTHTQALALAYAVLPLFLVVLRNVNNNDVSYPQNSQFHWNSQSSLQRRFIALCWTENFIFNFCFVQIGHWKWPTKNQWILCWKLILTDFIRQHTNKPSVLECEMHLAIIFYLFVARANANSRIQSNKQ